MSILNSIHAAEAKAEQYKQEAKAEVEALILASKEKAEAEGKAKIMEARETAKVMESTNKVETEEKCLEVKAKYDQEIKGIVSQADSRVDIAINYIMKKVVSS